MKAFDASGIECALALYRAPHLAADVRAQALPEGMIWVIRTAASDSQTLETLVQHYTEPAEDLVEACGFYVQQSMFAPEADAYRVLGVTQGEDAAVIREHHRWLIRWLHPDRIGEDWLGVFADRVNRAWHQLRNPERRQQYDADRAAGVPEQPGFVPPARAPRISGRHPLFRGAPAPHSKARWVAAAALVMGVVVIAFAWRHAAQPPSFSEGALGLGEGADFSPAYMQEIAARRGEAAAPSPLSGAPRSATTQPRPSDAASLSTPLRSLDDDRQWEALPSLPPLPATTSSSPTPLASATSSSIHPPIATTSSTLPHPLAGNSASLPPTPEGTSASLPPPPAGTSDSLPPPLAGEDRGGGPTEPESTSSPGGPRPMVTTPSAPRPPVTERGEAVAADTGAQSPPSAVDTPVPVDPPTLDADSVLAFIANFQVAYARGELGEFMELFSSNARNNRGGRHAIREDYDLLFATTRSRQIEFEDLRWKLEGSGGEVQATFLARVEPLQGRRAAQTRGEIRFGLVLENGEPRISSVLHNVR